MSASLTRLIAGLERTGHEFRVTDLYADDFDPAFNAHDRSVHLIPGIAPSLAQYADDLRWCDALVLVYPTWWSGQPAMLKGWMDRVWVCGVAWALPPGANRIRPLLRNIRRITVITTHGSGKLTNSLEGEAGKRTVTRSLRVLCHPLCRTGWWAFYGLDTATDTERDAFLDRVERRAASM